MKSLGISDNDVLLTKVHNSQGKVLDAIKEFEAHPSILKIKEHVVVEKEFSFVEVSQIFIWMFFVRNLLKRHVYLSNLKVVSQSLHVHNAMHYLVE